MYHLTADSEVVFFCPPTRERMLIPQGSKMRKNRVEKKW